MVDAKIELYGVLTAVKKNMDVVKGSPESKHVAVIKLKKESFDKDENLKPGTGHPWFNLTITDFDPETFEWLKALEMGKSMVKVTVERA